MSIASEITRLQGAKSDLKDAIEGKGVTVPSATKLDGYADLVDAISQGGGTLGTKTIMANGQYDASDDGYDGYSEIDVRVPNTYSASDEGKVVSNGALVAQTAHADVTPTTFDQTIDTTTNNSLKVIGDADLVAGNIKKDVVLFGITGTYEGGGSFPNLMNFEEVLVTSTATEISVQLTPSNSCCVLSLIKDIGVPDATYYKTLYWAKKIFNGQISSNDSALLRPNGTIGTEGGAASYNETTGVFKFGNAGYGKAFAGDTYYIYQFAIDA